MKNKLRRDIFVIIFLLLVACIALAVPDGSLIQTISDRDRLPHIAGTEER